jgi:hypothetical protein
LRGAVSGSSFSSASSESDGPSSERASVAELSGSPDSSSSSFLAEARGEEGGFEAFASDEGVFIGEPDEVEYAPLRADLPF